MNNSIACDVHTEFFFRDDDFQKFTQREEEIKLMRSQYRQMEMRLESYEKTHEEMEDVARSVYYTFVFMVFNIGLSGYRRYVQALEARLAIEKKRNETSRQLPAQDLAAFIAEKSSLVKSNEKLREENMDLRDEVEEMRAMLEMLKAQVSGRKGLVSARSSPIMFPA